MILGVIADSHDNLPALKAALEALRSGGAERVVHAGDVIAPFAAKVLAGCGLPVSAVYGNNDGEKAGLARLLDIAEGPRLLTFGGRKLLLAHDVAGIPEREKAGADILVVGHSHEAYFMPGAPPVLNPGECGGWVTGKKTFAFLDLDSLEARVVEF